MPPLNSHRSPEHYYSTAFHEIAHSIGHATRLSRPGIVNLGPTTGFGTHAYGVEELAAQMGASMLLAETGIDTDEVMENSAAYCASWIATIREDPKIIVRAASQGAKITDLVMEPYREAHPIAELEGDADAEDQGEDAEYERAAQALRAEYDAQVAEVQADEPELEMA